MPLEQSEPGVDEWEGRSERNWGEVDRQGNHIGLAKDWKDISVYSEGCMEPRQGSKEQRGNMI